MGFQSSAAVYPACTSDHVEQYSSYTCCISHNTKTLGIEADESTRTRNTVQAK
jgi:hypothetical protein